MKFRAIEHNSEVPSTKMSSQISEYKKGVLVRCVKPNGPVKKGMIGTLLEDITNIYPGMLISVEWKDIKEGGHYCGGLCKSEQGWNVLIDYIELL
jgi:hypothetical protein